MNGPFLRCAAACLLVVAASGCGYQFSGAVSPFSKEIQTISLGPIENRTREVRLERDLLEGLEDEFALRGLLEVVPAGEGDLTLTGSIREYRVQPVAFNSRDEVLQYQVEIWVDLELRNRATGKLEWVARGLSAVEDYGAISGVLVTGSSAFARTNPAAGDLTGFTDIQVSESERREATERLIESMSREVYNGIMDDF